MRRILRWARRIVLGALALGALAVLAIVILMHTAWGREQIRARVESALRDEFPGGARIGALEGTVLGVLVLRDVELDGADHRPLATIKTLRIDLALWPLLGATARVKQLIAEDVVIDARPQPPRPPSPSPSSWDVALDRVEVRRATLRIGGLVLEDVELVGAAALDAGAPITATGTVRGTWRRDRDRAMPIAAAAWLRYDAGLTIPLVAATLGERSTGVAITGANLDVAAATGTIAVAAPAAAVVALVPGLVVPGPPVPGDLVAVVDLTRAAGARRLTVFGMLGAAHVQGWLRADDDVRHAAGVIAVASADLARVTGGRVVGAGTAIAAIGASRDDATLHGAISAWGAIQGLPAAQATIAFAADAGGVRGLAVASGDGDLRAVATVDLTRDGARLALARADLFARTRDVGAVTAGRAALDGELDLALAAHGPLWPAPALAITGQARGAHLRQGDLRAGTARASFAGDVTRTSARGHAHLALAGVSRAGQALGALEVDVATGVDDRVAVEVRARPAIGGALQATAIVTPGATIAIALGKHHVRTPTGDDWRGRGGHVTIAADRITIAELRSAHGDGRVALDGRYARATGAIAATLTATAIPMAMFDPASAGVVGGTVRVEGRRVRVDARASDPARGAIDLALDVQGPRDLLDVAAWRGVERRDLRAVTIAVRGIEAHALDPRASGVVDGEVTLTPTATRGALAIRRVVTPAGTVDLDLGVAPGDDPATIAVDGRAALAGVGAATLRAELALPTRLFDPAAWRALGPGALRAGTLELRDLPFDPTLLARLGVDAPYRGRASLVATVGPGGTAARLALDAIGVRGGPLAAPIDVHLEATPDGHAQTLVIATVATANGPLVELTGTASTSLDRLLAGGPALAATPIRGTVTIPSARAADLLAILGRQDVVTGTLDGTATLDGTIGAPTGRAAVTAHDVRIAAPVAGQRGPTLVELAITARWDGHAGALEARGRESDGGTLHVTASGRPDALATAAAQVEVAGFEIAPLALFLPDAMVGTSGHLDATLAIRGLDPATSDVRGRLHLVDGRIPMSPTLGTLRQATADVTIADRRLDLRLDGRLGAGTVAITGQGGLDAITATATLRRVSPITSLHPAIDADVTADLRRTGARWGGRVRVRHGAITIPEDTGDVLLDADAPPDLVFADAAGVALPAQRARPPVDPWLTVQLDLDSTTVTGRGMRGTIHGQLDVAIGGEAIGLYRTIEVEHLDIDDLFGRRYAVERGVVRFDGTTDGLLDVRLVHAFPELTLIVALGGRISDPTVDFASEPGTYTRDQLLGFFIGGEPGGDPTSQTREAATGASASLLSQRLGGRLTRVLPVKIDVLRCAPATSTTSAGCTVGKWLSARLFVAFEQHLEALPAENSADVHVQYYLPHDFLLEASGGDRNYDTFDILWRHRW